jgi:hypothetical protein
MKSEWITDRLPKKSDLVGVESDVWYYCCDMGYAFRCHWSDIKNLGQPWQPIQAPATYVKPERWTVKYNDDIGRWYLYENGIEVHRLYGKLTEAAAEDIAAIYNEVAP